MQELSNGEGDHAMTTCPNCNERAHDHMRVGAGPNDPQADWCWFCKKKPRALSEETIPLNLDWKQREITPEQREVLVEWSRLKQQYGELTVMEEALVSRVSSCVSVLQLPGCWVENKQYSQLGYRGSVINFVNELSTVAAQLPRAPKDSGIMVYVSEGVTKHGDAYRKLLNVERKKVEAYLRFFGKHHEGYRAGIRDPSNPSQ